MTVIMSLLGSLGGWPALILAVLGSAVGVFFYGKKKGSDAAAPAIAAVQDKLAAQTAAIKVADAQGDAQAAQAVTTATTDRVAVDAAVANEAPAAVKAELASDWTKPAGG